MPVNEVPVVPVYVMISDPITIVPDGEAKPVVDTTLIVAVLVAVGIAEVSVVSTVPEAIFICVIAGPVVTPPQRPAPQPTCAVPDTVPLFS